MTGSTDKIKNIKSDKKRLLKFFIIMLLIGTFSFSTYTTTKNIIKYKQIKSEISEINTEYKDLSFNNKMLKERLNSKNKRQLIIDEAHKRGYTYSNEITFYDISSGD